jgi:hypothetical protein
MSERPRFPWFLFAGLALGLVAGLVVSMLIAPTHYTQTSPAALSAAAKEDYRALISLAYLSDGDLGRATSRLMLLGDTNVVDELAAQSQRVYARGGSTDEAQALSLLAVSLYQLGHSATQQVLGTPVLGTPIQLPTELNVTRAPTFTPLPTFTPRPSPTVTPTQGAPFALAAREQTCDPDIMPALIQVEVYDAANTPVWGVPLTVTWNGGSNTFHTGLFPLINDGYADFQMSPDVVYTLQAGINGEQVGNLQAPQCTKPDGTTYWGGWKLSFKQP